MPNEPVTLMQDVDGAFNIYNMPNILAPVLVHPTMISYCTRTRVQLGFEPGKMTHRTCSPINIWSHR